MTIAQPIRTDHSAREQSLGLAIGMDAGLIALMIGSALIGGSLTMLAESVRATLMLGTEVFAFVALRRIHRGQLAGLEFGHGKLEQLANLAIAVGMLCGAAWIGVDALGLIAGTRPPGTPAGLAAAALVGALNTYLNFLAWLAVHEATPDDSSIIMRAQLRSRLVKLSSSAIVLGLLTISAVYHDPGIVAGADVTGALIVTAFLVSNAIEMLRGGLPDLLDNSVDETLQRRLNRALARHFDDYDWLGRVRTRRSGGTVFVEIALGFAPELTAGEIHRRVQQLRATLQGEIPRAEVAVLVSAVGGGDTQL